MSRREFIRQSFPLAAIVAAPFGGSRSEAAIPGKSDLALTVTLSAVKADELKQVKGVNLVRAHCVACHSLKLVTQHRISRIGWLASIRYMQKNRNLRPLGEHERSLLDYLALNYGPDSNARKRRANLPYISHD